MIGHQGPLRENDDLLSGIKKKATFFNVRALAMHEIMLSKDAQCNDDLNINSRHPRWM